MAIKPTHCLANLPESAERQLALEIRSWRFGFAVLEGDDLLEFGARRFPTSLAGAKVAVRSLTFLMRLYAPSVVITRSTRRAQDESSTHVSAIFRSIRHEVESRSVRFVVLPRSEVLEFFGERGRHAKHEIAAFVGDHFSQLESSVPRRRKAWEPERYLLVVFDAIATALAFRAMNPHTEQTAQV
jgi:hypothetical protein